MKKNILQAYQQKITDGALHEDATQIAVIDDLDNLAHTLENNPASWQPYGQLYKWAYTNGENAPAQAPLGGYFFGTVGRGKSMLMDLFFDHVAISHKRRVHFHSFMDEVHKRMHETKPQKGVDPVHKVAVDIAKDAQLLCFDEFYISNIADAMMLGRLFEMLLKSGVVLCSTSNWAPENLFQGGHNRVLFKPFIKMIEKSFHIWPLGEGQDWRRINGDALPYFYVDNKTQTAKTFQHLSQGTALCDQDVYIVNDKVMHLAQTAKILHVHFDELCGKAFAAEHYKEIAEKYETVILDDIPLFTENRQDEAMRFVVLVDMFYEMGTKLVCSAADLPHLLCPKGESAFAFARTASRLIEMQNRF
ncbi:MAG: cell division protein ZapE [Alphaproteobacteria bacterium]|jgi:cell division protein ZapE